MPTSELVAFLNPGREDQVQVRGVHVAIGNDRTIGQDGKRRCNTGLAGAAFAADDNEFLHASMFL